MAVSGPAVCRSIAAPDAVERAAAVLRNRGPALAVLCVSGLAAALRL